MSRQYNNEGNDQVNVEKNHGNINIFNAGFHALEKFVEQIFWYITPVLLQDSSDLTQYSTEQENLEIRKEELRIQRDRLNHEINSSGIIIDIEKNRLEIQEKEFHLRCRYFRIRLQLIRKYQAEKIQLKLQEFQENWDVHNSPLLISRQELSRFFIQQGDELSILLAPPKIPRSLEEEFSSLEKELEYSIKNKIEKYYSYASEDTYPIIKYHQLFKRPIGDFEARSTSESLKPFPTLIINSEITDREVYVTVTFSAFTNSNTQNINNQINLPPWDWEEIKEALDLQGQYSKDNIRRVRKLIADFHIVIALYFSDLYCLNLDPYHKHKLLSFLEENCKFPEPLQETIEFYRNSLRKIQVSIQDSIRSQIIQPVRNNNTYSYSNDSPDALGCGTMLALGIGIMLLFGFCSQNLPTLDPANIRGQNSLQNYKGKSGIIQVNRPDKKPVNLRSAPNGKVIGILQNGTHVTLEALSSDQRWQKVKTKDGKSGWVWAEFVAVAS